MTSQGMELILIEAITAGKHNFPLNDQLASAILQDANEIKLSGLNFDSLAWMEFCISIELNTGVELTPDHLEKFETLADVAAWIKSWPES